jgi:tRNA-Thr(GGU) m(6)t(6)A37 methyltransferase TsaA
MATHLFVLYWFDRSDRTSLLRDARGGAGVRGVFASRSPNRPNPVALSVVRLISRDGNRLRISGLDCLDGTRVVDLKPYVPDDDRIADAKIGWNYETGAPLSDGAHPEGCQCRPAAHS